MFTVIFHLWHWHQHSH